MTNSTHPLLYQVNTRVWLARLSQELSRQATLDDLPEVELDAIARQGFEWVYFLGVWQTGEAGRQISRANPEWLAAYRQCLPDLTEDDICGSPFAITGYAASAAMGGDEALQRLRQRLKQRDLRLMLDFVPNHTAPDHPWVVEHPEYYVSGSEDDLKAEPQNYFFVQTAFGSKILARGRDPYFPGWSDTAQLNYGNPALQQAMQNELIRISGLCDGLRCDMAMLVLPEIFEQTWKIASAPFWPAAISAVRENHPGFTFMAEVYWDLENTLLEQGFDVAYDKRLYDCLVEQDAPSTQAHLQATAMTAGKLARFLENHDEKRAAAVFPPDVHQAAAVLTYLAPGLRFFHQGQLEGYHARISVHLCRGLREQVDPRLSEFYNRLLACLKMESFHTGQWRLLTTRAAWEGNHTHSDFIAYTWQGPTVEHLVVVVNYSGHQSQCYLPLPLPELTGKVIRLVDHMGPYVYVRKGDDLLTTGLYLDLPAWGYHVFELSELDDRTGVSTASESAALPRKKLGLALGGGGARGLAHIGILKVLAREGIQIDILAGTSMGGLVAAIYGAGLPPEEIEAEAVKRSTTFEIIKLVDVNPSIKGFVKGQRIYNLLADTLGPELTFADLKIPVAMVAGDLLTGKEVIIKDGKVVDAVRATISVPGVFVPVNVGPYRLVDGGVLNNVPVNVARELGADLVIAVDVLPNFYQNQPGEPPVVHPLNPPRLPKPFKELYNVLMIMMSDMTEYHLQIYAPDLMIRPDLPSDLDILMSFDRPADAILAGEKAAEEALPRIRALLSGLST